MCHGTKYQEQWCITEESCREIGVIFVDDNGNCRKRKKITNSLTKLKRKTKKQYKLKLKQKRFQNENEKQKQFGN